LPAIHGGSVARGFESIDVALEASGLLFGIFQEGGKVLAFFGFEELLERFLDAEETEKGPHEFIEFAQAGVGGGISGGEQIIGAGGLDVATDLGQAGVAGAAVGGK
jgi:hypothetical protein